jgi:hypothetical protein
MLKPRRLTAVWASTACYRDSVTFTCFGKSGHYINDSNLLSTGFFVPPSSVLVSNYYQLVAGDILNYRKVNGILVLVWINMNSVF